MSNFHLLATKQQGCHDLLFACLHPFSCVQTQAGLSIRIMQVICGTPILEFDPNAKVAEPGKLSGGGIAGIVVGALAGVALTLIGGLVGYKSYQDYKVSLPEAMPNVVMRLYC